MRSPESQFYSLHRFSAVPHVAAPVSAVAASVSAFPEPPIRIRVESGSFSPFVAAVAAVAAFSTHISLSARNFSLASAAPYLTLLAVPPLGKC